MQHLQVKEETKVQDLMRALCAQSRAESVIANLNETGEFNIRSVRHPKRPSQNWEISNYLNWEEFLRKCSARLAPSTGQKECWTALAENV